MEQRGFVFQAENLLSPQAAIATFLARARMRAPAVERVALDEAFGRVLAEDLAADRDYPSTPRSAMDGFAVRAADMPGSVPIIGEISMGAAWNGPLAPGSSVRIPTGGVVPDGAYAVVPIEDATLRDGYVQVDTVVTPGDNINERGCDMHRGDPALFVGTRITAPQLGLLATLGITRVPVFVRPRVAVISSGDELVPPDAEPAIGEIRDSNRYAIAATLRAMGVDAVHLPTVSDEPGALASALAAALSAADGAVLTGGSSVGERDQTPDAIASLGEPGVIVHGLRVKPGKPTVLAAIGDKPVIGLPGNPTSAVIILQAVVAPVIAALCGRRFQGEMFQATLDAEVRSRPGWTWYVPVTLEEREGRLTAHPLPLRSSTVSAIARAEGYVIVPEEIEAYPAGTLVSVARFI